MVNLSPSTLRYTAHGFCYAGKPPMLCSLTSIPHRYLHANSTRLRSRENCCCKMSDTQSPRLSWDLGLGSSPRTLRRGCAQIWISSSPPICRRSAPSSRQTFDRVPQSKCAPLHGARGSTPTPCPKSSVYCLRVGQHGIRHTYSAATLYVFESDTVWGCGRSHLLASLGLLSGTAGSAAPIPASSHLSAACQSHRY